MESLIKNTNEIEAKLKYTFKDKSLLMLAFIHCSYVNEHRELMGQHNERLEFLGDSVLGVLIADYLYNHLPSHAEGELSHLRSRLVDGNSCMLYVQKLQVEKYMLLGKGEKRSDGRGRSSILADLFEAIMGAIYLDGGIGAAAQFLFGNFQDEIDAIIKEPLRNWKADLQDYAQKVLQHTPVYKVLSEEGPDHNKKFIVIALLHDVEIGRGSGSSKKEAQQAAAQDALMKYEST